MYQNHVGNGSGLAAPILAFAAWLAAFSWMLLHFG
jgi:hypothetical protein